MEMTEINGNNGVSTTPNCSTGEAGLDLPADVDVSKIWMAVDENDDASSASRKSSVSGSSSLTDGSLSPDGNGLKRKAKGFLSLFKKSPFRTTNGSSDGELAAQNGDRLPQQFLAKYLGKSNCKGLWGIQHTREPVEQLVEAVADMKPGEDLPLIDLQVSVRGMLVREHPKSQVRMTGCGEIPLEFISYGVQDVKYTRVFSFILVKEMSLKSRVLECHAYVCDTEVTARKLSLAVALAFSEYVKQLKGRPHRFQVDLRPATEIEDEVKDDKDCDA